MAYTFIFDEKKEADKILENGFQKGYATKREMILLLKHYRWELGYGEQKMRKNLIEFCYEHDCEFNEVRRGKTIRDSISVAMKYNFITSSPVFITQAEIDKIKTVKNFLYQKILFTILVIAKEMKFRENHANPSTLIGYFISTEFFPTIRQMIITGSNKRSGISLKRLQYLKHEFYLLGLVEPTENNKLRINYANDQSDVVIVVEDVENPIKYYLDYCGGELTWCSTCGKEIIKTGNKKMMCADCFKEERHKYQVNWMREKRGK